MSSRSVGCDQRIAWLLTATRLLGQDAQLARRDVFISFLDDHGVHVDSSRVSRWESGLQTLPRHVLRTYEGALGVPDGSFVALASGLRRSFGSTGTPREATAAGATLRESETESLFDRIEHGEATGGDWMRLAEHLGGYDRVYLRTKDWQSLAAVLVRELAGSIGAAHLRRYEAASALLRLPVAQRHLMRAVGEFITDPDAQVITPVLNLLAEATDDAADDLVLRLLHVEHRDLRRGASAVASVKLARGHFGEEALKHLEMSVIGNLRRGGSLDARLDSFDLAVQLPEESWGRVQGALRNRRAFDLVERSRQSGELVPWSQTAPFVNGMAVRIQAATPTDRPFEPDLMLTRLLRESLLHAHKPRRHYASLLLAASPYAAQVARECQELAASDNDLLAARAWTVLMRVGTPDPRAALDQAVAETRPLIKARAIINVGLAPGPLDPAGAELLVDQLEQGTKPLEHQAAMFALGMRGAGVVETLAGVDSPSVGRAAAWWLRQGAAHADSDEIGTVS